MISAYCGKCDKQIELDEFSVVKGFDDKGNLYAVIRCNRCNDYEEVLLEIITPYKLQSWLKKLNDVGV